MSGAQKTLRICCAPAAATVATVATVVSGWGDSETHATAGGTYCNFSKVLHLSCVLPHTNATQTPRLWYGG